MGAQRGDAGQRLRVRAVDARVAIAVDEIAAAKESVGGRALYDVTLVNDDLQATIRAVEALLWP